jgi:hypothetical protein
MVKLMCGLLGIGMVARKTWRWRTFARILNTILEERPVDNLQSLLQAVDLTLQGSVAPLKHMSMLLNKKCHYFK